MVNFSNWFKKPIKLSEREQYIFKIVKLMLVNPTSEIKINPELMDYYIHNEANHLDIIIGNSYIAITNSNTMVREDYRLDFIDYCKHFCKLRATKDREKLKDNILRRESDMFEQIIKVLSDDSEVVEG